MSRLLDLGRRVELQSMDSHFHDVTIGLYRRLHEDIPHYTIHSYAELPGSADRVSGIADNMQILGGLSTTAATCVNPACGQDHPLAIQRVFLESCKLSPAQSAASATLSVTDRKSGLEIEAVGLGDGQYRIAASGDAADEVKARRVGVIVNGLRKLGQMQAVADADGQALEDCVSFNCGHDHDALVALLLQRAPNIRALVREEQAAAARGVLAAPSAQS